jgi:hypothetical protein
MAVRRVRRVLRKIDPWTVLKVSVVFFAIFVFALGVGLSIAWTLLRNSGWPDTLVDIVNDLGVFEEDINLDGVNMARFIVFFSISSAIFMTGLATLASVFYNLISDVVGGIEYVVLEEVLEAPRSGGAVRQARTSHVAGDAATSTPLTNRPTVRRQPSR